MTRGELVNVAIGRLIDSLSDVYDEHLREDSKESIELESQWTSIAKEALEYVVREYEDAVY